MSKISDRFSVSGKKPLEVADLVLFLASQASDFITGQIILIDGGYTII